MLESRFGSNNVVHFSTCGTEKVKYEYWSRQVNDDRKSENAFSVPALEQAIDWAVPGLCCSMVCSQYRCQSRQAG
jgi:hypothetical protein